MLKDPPYDGPDIPDLPTLPDINVSLLVGLVSGITTFLLVLGLFSVYMLVFGSDRLFLPAGEPASFDEVSDYDDEERELAMDQMDPSAQVMYLRAKAFQQTHPPCSEPTDLGLSQFLRIREQGVSAWQFEPDYTSAAVLVQARTEIQFFDNNPCCVQTNLPIPRQNETYYFEAKIFDVPEDADTAISIGLTTKPYPTFRLPGRHRYSLSYDSDGSRRVNRPFPVTPIYPKFYKGDVIGIGYRSRQGTIFFTRNGRRLGESVRGVRYNVFPTIGASGPCTVHVNLGQGGFVFIEANVKKWGFAPIRGTLGPPPKYGEEERDVLLERGEQGLQSRPPSFNDVERININERTSLLDPNNSASTHPQYQSTIVTDTSFHASTPPTQTIPDAPHSINSLPPSYKSQSSVPTPSTTRTNHGSSTISNSDSSSIIRNSPLVPHGLRLVTSTSTSSTSAELDPASNTQNGLTQESSSQGSQFSDDHSHTQKDSIIQKKFSTSHITGTDKILGLANRKPIYDGSNSDVTSPISQPSHVSEGQYEEMLNHSTQNLNSDHIQNEGH